jgi:acyl-CoA synthetase (AMP-forming)/AMP-acid ligase II
VTDTPGARLRRKGAVTSTQRDRVSALSVEGIVSSAASTPRVDWPSVAEIARETMARHRARPAFILPGGSTAQVVAFGALGSLVDRFMAGLGALELPRGSRVLLLAPPNPRVYAFAVAVLGAGHSLVTIDGRGDVARLREALERANADVVIGAPRIMWWWPFTTALRRARRFTVGGFVPGARSLDALLETDDRRLPLPVDADLPAVFSFTSGNTGVPKCVVRSHAVLSAQHRALVEAFPVPPGDVNLPGFPLAVLHNLCRGTTTVLPSADLRSMADADVATVVRAIRDHGVTSVSGAPAFVGRIAAHVLSRRESLRHVRLVVVGGGPVSRRLARDLLEAFSSAEVRVVYGATEAEPIATADAREIVAAGRSAEGYLAGRPVSDMEVRVDTNGELLVRGPQVAHATCEWHRTGDICRIDAAGRLWLLGRIGIEIQRDARTVHPFVVEAHVSCIAGVIANALVAHRGAPEGELVVHVEVDADPYAVIQSTLADLDLADLPVRTVDAVPMDRRHQSKVDRGALARRLEASSR